MRQKHRAMGARNKKALPVGRAEFLLLTSIGVPGADAASKPHLLGRLDGGALDAVPEAARRDVGGRSRAASRLGNKA